MCVFRSNWCTIQSWLVGTTQLTYWSEWKRDIWSDELNQVRIATHMGRNHYQSTQRNLKNDDAPTDSIPPNTRFRGLRLCFFVGSYSRTLPTTDSTTPIVVYSKSFWKHSQLNYKITDTTLSYFKTRPSFIQHEHYHEASTVLPLLSTLRIDCQHGDGIPRTLRSQTRQPWKPRLWRVWSIGEAEETNSRQAWTNWSWLVSTNIVMNHYWINRARLS